MAEGNRSFFGALTGAAQAEEGAGARKRRAGYLDQRENALSRLASGEVVDKTLLWVDPERCRMWPRHNRRYELLSEQRCADLIDGFKAQGHQEFPAIVRSLKGDPEFDYEVVCGARRHWTVQWLREHNYPEFKFLIEVRDLTDEQAFRLSDIENRDRQDISDYERATDYLNALGSYYENHLSRMAERLEVTVDWLSRYLDVAKLPDAVVEAYADLTQIRMQHARELKPLLKDGKTRKHVLSVARKLAEAQGRAREAGRGLLDGTAVIRELKAATRPKKAAAGVLARYESQRTRKPMLEVSRKGRSGLVLRVVPDSGATKGELLEACEQALGSFLT